MENYELNPDGMRPMQSKHIIEIDQKKYSVQILMFKKIGVLFHDHIEDRHKMYYCPSDPKCIYEKMPSWPESEDDLTADHKYLEWLGVHEEHLAASERELHVKMKNLKSEKRFKWNRWILPDHYSLDNTILSSKKDKQSPGCLKHDHVHIPGKRQNVMEMKCRQDHFKLRFMIALKDTLQAVEEDDDGASTDAKKAMEYLSKKRASRRKSAAKLVP